MILKKVQDCSYLIAYDVASGAINPCRVAFRVGLAMKAMLFCLDYYYRARLSRSVRSAILIDLFKVAIFFSAVEILFRFIPFFYGVNVKVHHLVDQRKFVIDFTPVTDSSMVTGVQAITIYAMTILFAFAALRSYRLCQYDLSNARFLLVILIPVTIFFSGFLGLINVDFNRIIQDRADICM
ncbi:MAG: hypothetical protein ACK4HV_05470 [Parachlamydiaceae bacterium]